MGLKGNGTNFNDLLSPVMMVCIFSEAPHCNWWITNRTGLKSNVWQETSETFPQIFWHFHPSTSFLRGSVGTAEFLKLKVSFIVESWPASQCASLHDWCKWWSLVYLPDNYSVPPENRCDYCCSVWSFSKQKLNTRLKRCVLLPSLVESFPTFFTFDHTQQQ